MLREPREHGAPGQPRHGPADAEPAARPARPAAVRPHGRPGPEPALRPDDGRVRQHHRPPAAAARRHLRPAAPAGQQGQRGQHGQQGQTGPARPGPAGSARAGQGQGQQGQGQTATSRVAAAWRSPARAARHARPPAARHARVRHERARPVRRRRARPWSGPSGRCARAISTAPTQEETRALEQLRQGARDMAQQMLRQMPSRFGANDSAGELDPMGRPPQRTDGPDPGVGVKVPDQIDVQRAREILEELRRRLGEHDAPAHGARLPRAPAQALLSQRSSLPFCATLCRGAHGLRPRERFVSSAATIRAEGWDVASQFCLNGRRIRSYSPRATTKL